MNTVKILGIDPGYDRCGWAVLESSGASNQKVIAYDCLTSDKKLDKLSRFRQIWQSIEEIANLYSIEEIAIESLFFSRNVSTALPVSEVRGIIFAVCFSHNIRIEEYNPGQIKSAVTGYGKADKAQVMNMVKRLLRLEKIPNVDDTGDALAVALTHAVSRTARQRTL